MNGSPTGFFHSYRGLRQGLYEPFLFIIVTEALSRLTKKLEESGLLAGFLVSEGAPPISHLQFADDTLFLCEANHLQLRLLRCTLRCFEAVSGLRINLMKSSIFAVGEVINIEERAADLGCKVGCLPSSYLGLPLGAKYRSKAIWVRWWNVLRGDLPFSVGIVESLFIQRWETHPYPQQRFFPFQSEPYYIFSLIIYHSILGSCED